jgi:hypothetical protein
MDDVLYRVVKKFQAKFPSLGRFLDNFDKEELTVEFMRSMLESVELLLLEDEAAGTSQMYKWWQLYFPKPVDNVYPYDALDTARGKLVPLAMLGRFALFWKTVESVTAMIMVYHNGIYYVTNPFALLWCVIVTHLTFLHTFKFSEVKRGLDRHNRESSDPCRMVHSTAHIRYKKHLVSFSLVYNIVFIVLTHFTACAGGPAPRWIPGSEPHLMVCCIRCTKRKWGTTSSGTLT